MVQLRLDTSMFQGGMPPDGDYGSKTTLSRVMACTAR